MQLIIEFEILSKIPKFKQNNLKLIVIWNLFNLLGELINILIKDFRIKALKVDKDKVFFCINTKIRLSVYGFRIIVLGSSLEWCPLSFLNLCIEWSCWLIFHFVKLALFLLFNWTIRLFVSHLDFVELFMEIFLI